MAAAEAVAVTPEEVLAGIPAEQLAERRIRALATLAQASLAQDAADAELVVLDLADDLPAAKAAWDAAKAAREAKEPVIADGEEKLAALRARQAELEERAALGRHMVPDDGDVDAFLASDVGASVDARRDRLAIEEEAGEIRQRIALVSNALSAPLADLEEALRDEARARAGYEVIVEAIADPLNHGRAEKTRAYRQRVTRQMGEVLALPGHPDWDLAVEALKDTMAASGVGEQVQADAIRAYAAGDPWARKIGGTTKTLPSGQTVIQEPGKPPVVYQGRATPEQLAAAPGHAQADTRHAGDIMAATWAGTGQAHRSQLGLPGVHH